MKKNINNLFVRINDKGFMISTLIYGIFIMFIVILSALMVTLNYRKNAFSNITIPEGSGTPGTKTEEEDKTDDSDDDETDDSDDDETGDLGDLYIDSTGCNPPKLKDGMIPVVYEYDTYNTGRWVKADANNTDGSWYNCSEKRFPNAVTVIPSYREKIKNANVGVNITSYISAMFVWVPRFSYIISSESVGIQFIADDVTHSGSASGHFAYKADGGLTAKTLENVFTPPAFKFGEENLSGFWVGKFETTEGLTIHDDSIPLTILPGKKSKRSLSVNSMFSNAASFTKDSNLYGLSSSDYNAHMMKNSEWAAVAYLSKSQYGKAGHLKYSGSNKEIYINNSSTYITGTSAGTYASNSSSAGTYTYNYLDLSSSLDSDDQLLYGNGPGASTTGNIYGIYDMSGGAKEYVMGNYKGLKVKSNIDFSKVESKYYDNFTSTSGTGQALDETSGWYNDIKFPVFSDAQSWLLRGGSYANKSSSGNAGIFSYEAANGAASDGYGFRVVLS